MNNPDPVAFTIFGWDVTWYGILIALGVLGAVYIALQSAKKYRWEQDDILDVAILCIPIGIIGARLYYVIFQWPMYAADPIKIFMTWKGGLAIYGGIIGGILAAVFYCFWKKKSIWELLDIGAPCIAFGQAVGRWGNFINQEAYGAQITNPNLMWFPFAVKIDATNTIHYATFFYESAWCALVCVFLLLVRKRFRHSGDVVLAYLGLYSFERMFVEGLRTDSLMLGPLRVSQWLSGVIFCAVAIFFVGRWIYERKHPLLITNKLHTGYVWLEEAEPAAEAAGGSEERQEQEEEIDEDFDDEQTNVETIMTGKDHASVVLEAENMEDAPGENDESVVMDSDELRAKRDEKRLSGDTDQEG